MLRSIRKESLRTFGGAFLIAIVGFWIAYQYVEPAPPGRIIMSAGRQGGAYYLFAQRYQQILARNHVGLEVRETAGSVENLTRLRAVEDRADVAFVQGGTSLARGDTDLLSLGSLFYEPLWVFYHGGRPIRRLSELKGRRLAVGEAGSGTRIVALRLLDDTGVTHTSTLLADLGGQDAADALLNGRVDAAFFIGSVRAPVIQSLVKSRNVRLMSFEQAEAYTRLYPFLSKVSLPRGVSDLQRNLPPTTWCCLRPRPTSWRGATCIRRWRNFWCRRRRRSTHPRDCWSGKESFRRRGISSFPSATRPDASTSGGPRSCSDTSPSGRQP